MRDISSIHKKIWNCILKLKPSLIDEEMSISKHLHFDYGLDSLGFEKLILLLEDEWSIAIEEDFARSGFFSSIDGIAEFLIAYKGIDN